MPSLQGNEIFFFLVQKKKREHFFFLCNTQFTACCVCFVDKRHIFWPLLQCWGRRGQREQGEMAIHTRTQNGEPEWSLFIWLDMTSDPLTLTHRSIQVIPKAQRKEFHYRRNPAHSPDVRFTNRLKVATWPVKCKKLKYTCCICFINWHKCWRSIGIWSLLIDVAAL